MRMWSGREVALIGGLVWGLGSMGALCVAASVGASPAHATVAGSWGEGSDAFGPAGGTGDAAKQVEPPYPPQGDETVHENGSVTVRLGPANVQTFNIPTLEGMTRGFVKLSGVDLTDDRLIDDFSAINYCRIFSSYYPNEFVWQQARRAVRKIVERDLETYPETFVLNGRLPLGRYNFEAYAFEIKPDAQFKNTGLFDLRFILPEACAPLRRVAVLPQNYTIRLDNPLTMEKIPAPKSLAQEVVRVMDRNENYRREAFVSFYVRVNDFSAVERLNGLTADVRSSLLAFRVYADSDRKLLIYDYRPRASSRR